MSFLLNLLVYLALAIFLVGFTKRIYLFYQVKAPLKIPTTPAPLTKLGVVWRLFTEVAFLNSLFKSNKWTWVGGYAFHAALVFIFIRHLRYIFPVPEYLTFLNIFGMVAGLVMVGALGFLFIRRFYVERVRYISSLADYFVLLLLMAIGVSGLLMTFFIRPDIVSVKVALTGLLTFSPSSFPTDTVFILHLLLALLLMVYFPFSKLMHLGGLFFSPTRNQVDNPREERHITPWAK